jgi:hypothetical protein
VRHEIALHRAVDDDLRLSDNIRWNSQLLATGSLQEAALGITDGERCSLDINAALRRLPQHIFHCTLACNAAAIERDGLHSAGTLMDAAERRDSACQGLREYRDRTVYLPTGAALRDQRPMAPALLMRCLDAPLSVTDWYHLVNARVFFWIDAVRLSGYSKASSASDQVVYTVRTKPLVLKYADEMEVTPFNMGYAKRRGAPRGLRSFVPLREWARTGWAAERAAGCKPRAATAEPVELAVRASVRDFHEFVIDRRVLKAER